MARTPYKMEFTLIVRNAEGEHINGTGSRGDLSYAKRLAHSYLCIDRIGAASIDIHSHELGLPWQECSPLVTVTLDDDLEGGKNE